MTVGKGDKGPAPSASLPPEERIKAALNEITNKKQMNAVIEATHKAFKRIRELYPESNTIQHRDAPDFQYIIYEDESPSKTKSTVSMSETTAKTTVSVSQQTEPLNQPSTNNQPTSTTSFASSTLPHSNTIPVAPTQNTTTISTFSRLTPNPDAMETDPPVIPQKPTTETQPQQPIPLTRSNTDWLSKISINGWRAPTSPKPISTIMPSTATTTTTTSSSLQPFGNGFVFGSGSGQTGGLSFTQGLGGAGGGSGGVGANNASNGNASGFSFKSWNLEKQENPHGDGQESSSSSNNVNQSAAVVLKRAEERLGSGKNVEVPETPKTELKKVDSGSSDTTKVSESPPPASVAAPVPAPVLATVPAPAPASVAVVVKENVEEQSQEIRLTQRLDLFDPKCPGRFCSVPRRPLSHITNRIKGKISEQDHSKKPYILRANELIGPSVEHIEEFEAHRGDTVTLYPHIKPTVVVMDDPVLMNELFTNYIANCNISVSFRKYKPELDNPPVAPSPVIQDLTDTYNLWICASTMELPCLEYPFSPRFCKISVPKFDTTRFIIEMEFLGPVGWSGVRDDVGPFRVPRKKYPKRVWFVTCYSDMNNDTHRSATEIYFGMRDAMEIQAKLEIERGLLKRKEPWDLVKAERVGEEEVRCVEKVKSADSSTAFISSEPFPAGSSLERLNESAYWTTPYSHVYLLHRPEMCNEVPDIETGTLCTVPDYRKDKVYFIASFGRITSLAHVPPSCYENLPQHVLIELTTRPRHFITCKRITGNNTVTVFCYPMGPLFCEIRPQRRGRNIEKGYKWTYEGFDLLFNQYAVGFQIGLEEENRVGGYTHPRDGCKRFWIETNEADRLIGYFLEVQTRQMELDDKRGLLEIYCPVDNGVGAGGNEEIATMEGGGTMEVDALEGGPSSQETLVEAAGEVNESPVVKAVLRKRGSAMMDSGTSDKKTESKKAKVEYEIVPSPVKPQGSPSSFQEVDIPLPPSSDLGETPKAAPVAASSAPLSLSNSDNNVIPKERRKLAVPKFMNGKLMKQASEVGNEEN